MKIGLQKVHGKMICPLQNVDKFKCTIWMMEYFKIYGNLNAPDLFPRSLSLQFLNLEFWRHWQKSAQYVSQWKVLYGGDVYGLINMIEAIELYYF